MPSEDYVESIISKATELSIPSGWNWSNSAPSNITQNKIAVIGGGVTGRSIVIALLKAGFQTTLVARNELSLAKRMVEIWQTLAEELQKGRLSKSCVEKASELLRTSVKLESLNYVDLVIETVPESMPLKLEIFRTLDRVCPPHTILCTNTSTLDVETIARATNRPSKVVCMHFFTPAHMNKALEVIYCDEMTSQNSIQTVIEIGESLEKIAVIARNGPGFIGNRMFKCYVIEALKLLEDGYSVQELDTTFREFGFAIGPFQTIDLIGLDTLQLISEASNWDIGNIVKILCEKGRLGRKTGKGFYLYKGNHRQNDKEVDELLESIRKTEGKLLLTREDIIRICLYPLVNEGFRILNDKTVEHFESIDVLWVTGFGWPSTKYGPMHWAQCEGLARILEFLQYRKTEDPSYPWHPSSLLENLVNIGINLMPADHSEKINNGSMFNGNGHIE